MAGDAKRLAAMTQKTLEIHSSQPSSLQGAIKATRGVIKKFRMWRARYTTQKSGKCLVCLAFREIPCGEQDCGNGCAMDSRSRTALLLLVSTSIIGWSGISFAYRPFDSTDAAVADVGQLEVELGPVQFRRSEEERTLIAPAYILNYGFAKDWELVLEGRGEHPV